MLGTVSQENDLQPDERTPAVVQQDLLERVAQGDQRAFSDLYDLLSPRVFGLIKRLLRDHGVFAVHRDGLASGACVRVTPAVFTSEAQVDRLVVALRKIAV